MINPAQHTPPKWPMKFLRWIIRSEYLEEIEGDMEEVFQDLLEQHSAKKARRKYAFEALKLFRLSLLKPILTPYINVPTSMIRHNFLISYRSFLRHKSSFLINLLGLTSGLSCALLIFLWVQDELRVDQFHENKAHIYQIMQKNFMVDELKVLDWSPTPMAPALKEEAPEIVDATNYKLHWYNNGILAYEDQHLKATPMYADTNFLNVFTYPLVHGNKHEVLKDKHAAVLSESMAIKLFSSTTEAIGKTISWEKKVGNIADMSGIHTVTGVFKDLPGYGTDQFDVIFTFDYYLETNPNARLWENDQATACVLIKEGADIEELASKMDALSAANVDWERSFFLRKYADRYLHGNYVNGVQTGGRIVYVWVLSGIALLILIIASINFMNLSTARATIRVKEIGVKKTLGASRKSLIAQFVTESVFLSMCSLVFAILLVSAFLPQFNLITAKQLTLALDPNLWLGFLIITLFTGLLSSIYPALYLSGFQPVEVLKGKIQTSWGEIWSRKSLVVFQFAISLILIISVVIIYKQMNFVFSQNLNFDKDQVITLKGNGPLQDKVESFLSEARALPQVVQASNSNNKLVGGASWTGGISWEGRPDDLSFIINVFTSNHYFLETFDIRLKEGRTFSPKLISDTAKVILNEAAVKGMGLEDPIGEIITFWGEKVEIIGIVEDFVYQSAYEGIQPCIFRLMGKAFHVGDNLYIRIKAGQEKEAIAALGELYEAFNPGYIFDYRFLDEEYQDLYQAETKVASLSKYFAGLAILISCLGLFGLAAFTAERRNKEIGIRKILGASVWGIVRLLSTDFTKMVLIAILIALPVSYLIASNWLEGFAYRIDLQWWYFVGAAMLTLIIAWLTVSFQTLKAARINPAECLRDE